MSLTLSQHFFNIASGQVVSIHTLEIDRPYPVLFARRWHGQYGPTVLLTLRAEENVNVKVYLPKRYADGFDDQDIEDINTAKKQYKFIYKGRSGVAYVLNMVL